MNGCPPSSSTPQGAIAALSPRGAPMVIMQTTVRLVLASGVTSQTPPAVEVLEPAQGPIRRGM